MQCVGLAGALVACTHNTLSPLPSFSWLFVRIGVLCVGLAGALIRATCHHCQSVIEKAVAAGCYYPMCAHMPKEPQHTEHTTPIISLHRPWPKASRPNQGLLPQCCHPTFPSSLPFSCFSHMTVSCAAHLGNSSKHIFATYEVPAGSAHRLKVFPSAGILVRKPTSYCNF